MPASIPLTYEQLMLVILSTSWLMGRITSPNSGLHGLLRNIRLVFKPQGSVFVTVFCFALMEPGCVTSDAMDRRTGNTCDGVARAGIGVGSFASRWPRGEPGACCPVDCYGSRLPRPLLARPVGMQPCVTQVSVVIMKAREVGRRNMYRAVTGKQNLCRCIFHAWAPTAHLYQHKPLPEIPCDWKHAKTCTIEPPGAEVPTQWMVFRLAVCIASTSCVPGLCWGDALWLVGVAAGQASALPPLEEGDPSLWVWDRSARLQQQCFQALFVRGRTMVTHKVVVQGHACEHVVGGMEKGHATLWAARRKPGA